MRPALPLLGTIGCLKLQLISLRGFAIAQDCIRKIAYHLDYSLDPIFLTDFMKMAFLVVFLPPQDARLYLPHDRPPTPSSTPPESLMHGNSEQRLTDCIVNAFCGASHQSLSDGAAVI